MNANGEPAAVSALQSMRSQAHYRQRPETELEDAIWPLDPNEPASSEWSNPMKVQLKSFASRRDARPSFTNNSSSTIRMLWLDYNGSEVAYYLIAPGERKSQWTYTTHPWIARDVTTGRRMMLNKSMVYICHVPLSNDEVVISGPPLLTWSRETHPFFPETFKASVKALLLVHQHLGSKGPEVDDRPALYRYATRARQAAAAAAAAVGADQEGANHLGSLPLELVVHIVQHMAPAVPQDISFSSAVGYPDIEPARLTEDPFKFAERKAALLQQQLQQQAAAANAPAGAAVAGGWGGDGDEVVDDAEQDGDGDDVIEEEVEEHVVGGGWDDE